MRREPNPPRWELAEPDVCVLLSTYNGARHVEAQLDSLRAQEGVRVSLQARDDGSTDGTPEILGRRSDHWPELLAVTAQANLGPARSFLELLRSAPADVGLYAFCDQDDIWLPGKLARAADALRDDHGPALYCSDVICVAEDLSPIGAASLGGDTRLQHLLFENVAFGCTMVMNRAARDLIVARPPDRAMIMHDWWCALVVAALGRIHYDPAPQVLYRQHTGNVVGVEADRLAQVMGQAGRFLGAPARFYPIRAQAAEFLRLFGDQLPAAARDAVGRLVGSNRAPWTRLAYALSKDVVRTRRLDSLVVRGLIAAGLH